MIVRTRPVHHEERSGQAVLRLTSVCRRTEASIAPGAGPDWRIGWVDFREGERLLIADQRPIRSTRPVNAVLPSCLPEDLVSAEKREVHTCVSCRLNTHTAGCRPIFIVAGIHIDFVICNK